jgi:aryl-alcohol dehydrogenase-like predicted oxidoreductase
VEQEYARLYEDTGLGLTTWSPLASGLLTGKYQQGIPEDSRGALANMAWMQAQLTDHQRNAAVAQLLPVAQELGCTMAQLAIAWAARNPRVSTVITGASRREQLLENLGALDLLPALKPAVIEHLDAVAAPLAD